MQSNREENNKLIISAAGSGKTTYIVEQALKESNENILITTYTRENEAEIKRKLLEKNDGSIPNHINVQTWFSLLIEHGVKPFQSLLLDEDILGMDFVNKQSGVKFHREDGTPVPYKEDTETQRHYLNVRSEIYSDKLAKFVVRCNKLSDDDVFARLSRIYSHILVDEVQDLAGYDLNILRSLSKYINKLTLVGDPRQVTYLTHISKANSQFSEGKIQDYIEKNQYKKFPFLIDKDSLGVSHRNNQAVCEFSSQLYPDLPTAIACECDTCSNMRDKEHQGVFLVHPDNVNAYIREYNPIQLRWDKNKSVSDLSPTYNFGNSKGQTFNHVIIYPTEDMAAWIIDREKKLSPSTRAKFYVAITRARSSAAIVFSDTRNGNFDLEEYNPITHPISPI